MARVTCAISGIHFDVSYLETTHIPHSVGYYHPVFTIPITKLYQLYYQHTRNNLSPTDSYLLFCAFLHNTKQVDWQHPASLNPHEARTKKLIQNNLAQLIKVTEKTSIIQHPSFTQPSFVVSYDNCQLDQIGNWIIAWEENLILFNTKLADQYTRKSLQEIENRLSAMVDTGVPLDKLAGIVADWASQAAEFPHDKDDLYKKVIRSCFNSTKMFNTPLATIKEVKEFCECNIQAGSVHFHTLCEILKEGIHRHVDYLGGSPLALGYTLLPVSGTPSSRAELEVKNQAELLAIAAGAPLEPPVVSEYPDSLSFLKAKLAYRVALQVTKQLAAETEPDPVPKPKEIVQEIILLGDKEL